MGHGFRLAPGPVSEAGPFNHNHRAARHGICHTSEGRVRHAPCAWRERVLSTDTEYVTATGAFMRNLAAHVQHVSACQARPHQQRVGVLCGFELLAQGVGPSFLLLLPKVSPPVRFRLSPADANGAVQRARGLEWHGALWGGMGRGFDGGQWGQGVCAKRDGAAAGGRAGYTLQPAQCVTRVFLYGSVQGTYTRGSGTTLQPTQSVRHSLGLIETHPRRIILRFLKGCCAVVQLW